jgi:hypothetical protein
MIKGDYGQYHPVRLRDRVEQNDKEEEAGEYRTSLSLSLSVSPTLHIEISYFTPPYVPCHDVHLTSGPQS